ncbi:hypothetical protein [Metallosphaera tengchongensis]|uniref:hypothetical protein n=1 Tax=Metallosphaera tengchongensis TaxID=1532350 RepID=UPI001FE543AC|nr:hypothetical protein [Metallosphaera tengchongensis]
MEDLERKRDILEKELERLPSGHLEAKTVNGKVYYYLRFWEEGKLRSKYLGKEGEKMKERVERASELKRELLIVKEEERRLRKVLERISLALQEGKV